VVAQDNVASRCGGVLYAADGGHNAVHSAAFGAGQLPVSAAAAAAAMPISSCRSLCIETSVWGTACVRACMALRVWLSFPAQRCMWAGTNTELDCLREKVREL
jgi:hypothetical protein